MKHILIVGKQFSGLKNAILEKGYSYTLLQDIKATESADKKIKYRVLADFSSIDTILSAAREIDSQLKIDGVITVYENYVVATSEIAAHLNLPGLPIDSAKACTDKFAMRSLFAKCEEKISPDFTIASSLDDVKRFAETHDFPLILKPTNLAKSLLVTKNNSLEELIDNYEKALVEAPKVYEKYSPNSSPEFIVEEFLDGSIHSIDAYSDKDGNVALVNHIVDYQTGYDIGYDDNFHYSRIVPSKLSNSDQDALKHCAELGVKSLGMRSSPAHVEIIMTKNGPRIVEIGARNGGYRERLHRLAHGIDILGAAIDTCLGESISLTSHKNDYVAVLELFPKKPGVFEELLNIDTLRTLDSLEYLSVKSKPGEFVGKAGDGYKMCAIIIIHSETKEMFDRTLNFINESVKIITRPTES